jgi:hypothetical protein
MYEFPTFIAFCEALQKVRAKHGFCKHCQHIDPASVPAHLRKIPYPKCSVSLCLPIHLAGIVLPKKTAYYDHTHGGGFLIPTSYND